MAQHKCFVCQKPALRRCLGNYCSCYVCDDHLTEICDACSSRGEPDTEELREDSRNRQRKKSPHWLWG